MTMRMTASEIGRCAENAVCEHLIVHHYEIICRNYSIPSIGEIDLIARKGERILFVEVKGRVNLNFGGPFAAITVKKQQRLQRTAQYYLQRNDVMNNEIIFLAAAVWLDDQGTVRNIRLEPLFFT
jgi:putative endonuclease